MENKLKQLRTQLRLAMNGVVSTSMREKGLNYKLNFGVSLPKIKEIAAAYSKDASFAEVLWKQDVREMKILATMLYPVEDFTPEKAEQWACQTTNQEIAEQYVFNLLQEVPYALSFAAKAILSEEEYVSVIGFLLYARLCLRGDEIPEAEATQLIDRAVAILEGGYSLRQRAALLALKHYGRKTPEQAAKVLSAVNHFKHSDSPEINEYYEDISFEFDYYL